LDERVTAWITEHIRNNGSAPRTRWSETTRRRLSYNACGELMVTCGMSTQLPGMSGRVDKYSGQRHMGGANGKAAAVVNGLPESGSSARRRHPLLYGNLVGLGVFALVAVPAAWSGFLAVASFSGCFISGECSEPEPLAGAVWALSALALLALPVITGVLVARAISGISRSVMALMILALLLCMVVLWFIWGAKLGLVGG
jgi:hypothetical protein